MSSALVTTTASTLNNIASLQNAMKNGSPGVQDELFKLIQAMYDPEVAFKVSTNAIQDTNNQLQVVNITFSSITGYARAFMISPMYGASPIMSMRNILQGTSLPIPSNMCQTGGTTLNFLGEVFVPEIGTPLRITPDLPKSFSIGRINSYEFELVSDSSSLRNDFVTGTIAYGVASDVRDNMGFDPTKLAMMSPVKKDGAEQIKAWTGAVAIQGPLFPPLGPVSEFLVAGEGDAGWSPNVLPANTTVPFNNLAASKVFGLAQPAFSGPLPTTLQSGVTANSAWTSSLYSNSIWVSPYAALQGGAIDSSVVQVLGAAVNVGYQANPKFEVEVTLPARTAAQVGFGSTYPTPSAGVIGLPFYDTVATSPYAVCVYHLYGQANGNVTNLMAIPQRQAVEVPIADPKGEFIRIPSGVNQNTGAPYSFTWEGNSEIASVEPGVAFSGAMGSVTKEFCAPKREGWLWLGTHIQAVDDTNYAALSDCSGATAAAIDPRQWAAVAWWSVDGGQQALGSGGVPLSSSVPWFFALTPTQTAQYLPTIKRVGMKIPRLYNGGNLGPARILRIENLGPDQTATFHGRMQSELVATGQTQQFKQTAADIVITDQNVITLAQLLFNSENLKGFCVNYRKEEYLRVKSMIKGMKSPADLLSLDAFLQPDIVKRAQAAGFFGDLIDNIGGLADTAVKLAPIAERLAPMFMAGGGYGQSAGMFGGGGDASGMFGAEGMFGDDEDDDDEDDDGEPQAAQAYAERFTDGVPSRLTLVPGAPAGLPSGMFESAGYIAHCFALWEKRGVTPSSLNGLHIKEALLHGFANGNMTPISADQIGHMLAHVAATCQEQGVQFVGKTNQEINDASQGSGSVHRNDVEAMAGTWITNKQKLEEYLQACDDKLGGAIGDVRIERACQRFQIMADAGNTPYYQQAQKLLPGRYIDPKSQKGMKRMAGKQGNKLASRYLSTVLYGIFGTGAATIVITKGVLNGKVGVFPRFVTWEALKAVMLNKQSKARTAFQALKSTRGARRDQWQRLIAQRQPRQFRHRGPSGYGGGFARTEPSSGTAAAGVDYTPVDVPVSDSEEEVDEPMPARQGRYAPGLANVGADGPFGI